MNYYEHHIRDYDAATAHLSWDEDLAYTRLIRWYYRKEKAIPADVKEACRQVRATTKGQRDAVESVLNEFFVLRDDGWHHDTCDEAIARYQEGEPERKVKKANEDNRIRRHREERARLFETLTAAGQHAPWNIPIGELRELVSRIAVTAPATLSDEAATQPVTAPATPVTATQSPDTNHQIEIHTAAVASKKYSMRADLLDRGIPEQIADDWLECRKKKKLANTLTAMEGVLLEAEKAGMGLEEALTVCCKEGWGGFKASWLQNNPSLVTGDKPWEQA